MSKEKWRPSASEKVIYIRSEFLKKIRFFFEKEKILEVETPTLLPYGVTDPQIESISIDEGLIANNKYYLHTSPELHMKRIISHLRKDIYQICKSYRADELGKWHEPEFTLLEWYRIGWDEHDLMNEVTSIIKMLLKPYFEIHKILKFKYDDIFKKVLDLELLNKDNLLDALKKNKIPYPENCTEIQLLDLSLNQIIIPSMDKNSIIYIYDYPINQSSLAKVDLNNNIAKRFEVFINGIEIGNGFNELTDAKEQRKRFENDNKKRKGLDKKEHLIDEGFLNALDHNFPECSGIALGLDRIIAIAADLNNIREAVTFSHLEKV
ncbi:MAG: hypothetical protein CBC38_03420 [Gammaproteobacteria bacterium TMED78]|nr:MAG: hypothetical protein CBC38_03420 [Gammaproteobacteria bacterium TMED78]